jgi:hypothetical protein
MKEGIDTIWTKSIRKKEGKNSDTERRWACVAIV